MSAGPEAGKILFSGNIYRTKKGRGHGFAKDQPTKPERSPEPRPSRIALTLALGHRIAQGIEAGEYRNRADAARKLGLTRARITQLLDLTLLAPDIQEEILEQRVGIETTERTLRSLVTELDWNRQRTPWFSKSEERRGLPSLRDMSAALAQ